MPSQLVGLFRTLAWSDYPARQEALPGAGVVRVAALTDATIASQSAPEVIPGTRSIRLRDSVKVTIALDTQASFKKSWVASLPQAEQDDLLAHEQGHYNLVALLGRDFFLALMQLKSKAYGGQGDLVNDINAADRTIALKSKPVQKAYDDDTKAGADKTAQAKWNGFISAAFSTPASPLRHTPDGVSVKVPILTILRQGGVSI